MLTGLIIVGVLIVLIVLFLSVITTSKAYIVTINNIRCHFSKKIRDNPSWIIPFLFVYYLLSFFIKSTNLTNDHVNNNRGNPIKATTIATPIMISNVFSLSHL